MRALMAKARTRIGWAVIGSAATLALGGVATAAVIDSPATDEVSDVSDVTTPAAETTAPETVVTESTVAATTEAPVDSPVAETPAATVEGVTEPTSTPAPPAADAPAAGESLGGQPPSPAAMPKLPGETGYVAPDASVEPPA